MKKRLLRLIGKGLAIIGIPIFLFFSWGVYSVLSYTGEYGPLPSEVVWIPAFALLGFSMIGIGVEILRRFEEGGPFLTKDGEPIHSGSVWKKGTESGLFLTLCGRVVSINQESQATAHVGYGIASAESTTCRECAMREGKAILEGVAPRRRY